MSNLRRLADLSCIFKHDDDIALHSTVLPHDIDAFNQSFDLEALERYRESVSAKNANLTYDEEMLEQEETDDDTITDPSTSQIKRNFPKKSLNMEALSYGRQTVRQIRVDQERRHKLLDFNLARENRKLKWSEFDTKLNADLSLVKACQEESNFKWKALLNQLIVDEETSRRRLRLPIFIPIFFEIEEVLFPELKEDALNLIRNVWNRAESESEVFADEFGIKISRHDLKTLQGLNWLNDEIINFYLSLVARRSETRKDLPRTYNFNTFFLTTLESRGYAGVKRWTRKVDIFSYTVLLVPVHLGNHWCLAVIDFKAKEINYFDSLGGTNNDCLTTLRKYIEEEHADKKKSAFDFTNWTFECRRNIPRQLNGSDCGVFTCCFAEFASRQGELKFDQRIMPYYRQRMVYEICRKELMI